MAAVVLETIKDEVVSWPQAPTPNKVDTHHHFVPDFYAEAVEQAGGDPSGWPTPSWTQAESERTMDKLGVRTAVLSVTAPGACVLQGQASHNLARNLNLEARRIRDEQPTRFGFFASLPSLLDTEAALEEIRFAVDELHADGVTLFTRYGQGNTYLGHPDLQPVWAELNRRKCVVFVHPTHPVDTTPVNSRMPQPMIDYPHETTRAAMDMIMQGTRARFPDCKVILSHAGGTLPYIISRIATPLSHTPNVAARLRLGVTHNSFLEAFRSFHFDLALSSSASVLHMLLKLVPHDHILYGASHLSATFRTHRSLRILRS
ncbi:amidohydrolase family protein [Aureobasidium subglaciale]|nr:amidohydrolase family protein [Aureobasidium subglaciale]